ncbi:hypothetical protein B484DRAFT_443937 [Ochromonadaceae sp. CCMP2298]|nr:hypothetical protein B484DRAFT_443937 [Ochromonadaceae sp. CCMP2298]
MSRQKNDAKTAAAGKGGGGAAGIKERTGVAGLNCSICRVNFVSAKMISQLKCHWESKHAKLTFAECFPGVPEA